MKLSKKTCPYLAHPEVEEAEEEEVVNLEDSVEDLEVAEVVLEEVMIDIIQEMKDQDMTMKMKKVRDLQEEIMMKRDPSE